MVYYAVLQLENPSQTVVAKLKERTCRQVMKDVTRDYEMDRILQAFEQAVIDCMPLKGYLMRKLYPKMEMRYMSDFDILADPSQLKTSRAILKNWAMRYTGMTAITIFSISKGFPCMWNCIRC